MQKWKQVYMHKINTENRNGGNRMVGCLVEWSCPEFLSSRPAIEGYLNVNVPKKEGWWKLSCWLATGDQEIQWGLGLSSQHLYKFPCHTAIKFTSTYCSNILKGMKYWTCQSHDWSRFVAIPLSRTCTRDPSVGGMGVVFFSPFSISMYDSNKVPSPFISKLK